MLRVLIVGAICACMFVNLAFAQDTMEATESAPAVSAYGYTLDDVAVNQGIVLYWYAHGYANCFGCPPQTFAQMVEKGLPLRKFMSPHNGDVIDPDDGSLDFDGDITYSPGSCGDVQVQVQTSTGVVTLPGVVCGHSDVSVQFDPCCCIYPCNGSVCIGIDKYECWNVCDGSDCACKIAQWMMWKSFETHKALYGMWPADELAWYASGLAVVDKNYKEYVPTMNIEFIYKDLRGCCYLKKAYVTCCAPCVPRSPCAKPACSPCNPCKTKCNNCAKPCESKCNPCKPKCDPCNPCKTKCNNCAKPCENKCNPCHPQMAPVAKSSCNTCSPCKTKCSSCAKPCESKCGSCKSKCGSCAKPCESKCGSCKPKCNTCSKCAAPAPKCNSCKPKTEKRCQPRCGSCG